jgi:D-alanine--poly(phosphoribitol) ligase subunit 2
VVPEDRLADGLNEKLTELILLRLDREVATPDTDLFASGLLDSLALVMLIAAVEDEFACEVPLEEFDPEHFRTVANIARFLRPVLS